MPVYEFICESCGAPFEELVRSHSAITDVRCPHCGRGHLRRTMSTFASRTSAGLRSGGAASSCTVGGT